MTRLPMFVIEVHLGFDIQKLIQFKIIIIKLNITFYLRLS